MLKVSARRRNKSDKREIEIAGKCRGPFTRTESERNWRRGQRATNREES
jgi:hypothetical protein